VVVHPHLLLPVRAGPSQRCCFQRAIARREAGGPTSRRFYADQLQNRAEKIERIVEEHQQQPKRRFKLTTDLKCAQLSLSLTPSLLLVWLFGRLASLFL
jgi:hypothetical protein